MRLALATQTSRALICTVSHGRGLASVTALRRRESFAHTRYRHFHSAACRLVAVQHIGSLPPTNFVPQQDVPKPTISLWLPQGEQRASAAGWMEAVERILPPHLRREGSSKALAYIDERPALSRIVLEARRSADVDVIGHLGLVEQRWDALLWVTNTLLEEPPPSTFFRDHAIKTSARWPSDQTFDEITSTSQAPESLFQDFNSEATAIADPSLSLEELTSFSHSAVQNRSHQQSRDVLGEIWRCLGHLIIVAASDRGDDNRFIMPAVLRIIAQLHRQEYVPNKVFVATAQDYGSAFGQPPLLQSLSSDIIMALVDTSVVIEASYSVNAVVRPPFKPELWLEFILWCCIHGGWLHGAAAIVSNLKKLAGKTQWHLISWHSGPDPLARDWTTSKAMDVYTEHPNSDDEISDGFRIRHTISSEVVIALIDGLVTAASSSGLENGPQQALEATQSLKAVLERSSMNLGVSSWDEIVARFAELPHVTVEDQARVLENILALSETFGREVNAKNALDKPGQRQPSPAYVFDGSAATIGLYHRLLAAYVRAKETDSALRILARLQHFTDANKTNALQGFLTQLTRQPSHKPTNTASDDKPGAPNGFQKVNYPSFFPNIPPVILASLLDLVTESKAFDVGAWMIRSQDVDGPLIPPELYGNQSVAPALIRFAAESGDFELLKILRRHQNAQVSGRTLVALAEGHILNSNWQGASDVLETLEQYSLHDWSGPDFARIVGASLHNFDVDSRPEEAAQSLQFLHQTLQGQFGVIWKKPSRRHSVVAVVSTMHTTLAEALKPFLDVSHMSKLDLTLNSFEKLLSRAVQSFGSHAGQTLWETWCRGDLASRQIREPDRSAVVNIPISQRAEAFSAGHNQPGPSRSPPLAPSMTGHIEPAISTLRIIVQQALTQYTASNVEANESSPSAEDSQTPDVPQKTSVSASTSVLEWAAQVFQQRFHLRPVDIEHELDGHQITQKQPEVSRPLYIYHTRKIWQAVHTASPTWTMTTENKMRTFAMDPTVDSVIFDAVDAAGRRFLHLLAADFGLVSESVGEEDERPVSVFKTPRKPEVPSITVAEAVRRVRKSKRHEAGALD